LRLERRSQGDPQQKSVGLAYQVEHSQIAFYSLSSRTVTLAADNIGSVAADVVAELVH